MTPAAQTMASIGVFKCSECDSGKLVQHAPGFGQVSHSLAGDVGSAGCGLCATVCVSACHAGSPGSTPGGRSSGVRAAMCRSTLMAGSGLS